MTSLLGKVFNRTPITYATGAGRLSLPLFGNRTNRRTQLSAMGSVGTLFAIVHRLSNDVSRVEWKLWRKAESGRKEDRVEVTRHLALQVWNQPNPHYTRQEFVEAVQQHVDLTGEGWWCLVSHPAMPGVPIEMWPVRPDRMEVDPHPTEFIAGYIYVGPDGQRVGLGLKEVIQLRMPNPEDPYRGMGPVQSLLVDLDCARYSAEWNRNFFRNSAEPGGIIEATSTLSDTEFERLTTRWNEQHKGVSNAHRVAVIEHGKWVPRAFSMRDMQFAELRTVSRDVILEAFGMHKGMLGIVEDVNRANLEAGMVWHARGPLISRLERWKGALNGDFLPLFGATGEGLEFDYENPVPEDRAAANDERTSKATAAKALVEAGYDPVDVASAMDLPGMRHTGRVPATTSAGGATP